MASTSSQLFMSCKSCADFIDYAKYIGNNGLYVSDLPPRASESHLYDLFSHFGQIVDFFLADNGTYCLVHFQNRYPVDEILSQPIGLYGRPLHVRPRKQSQTDLEKLTALNEVHKNHELVLKSISEKNDFTEQVKEFLRVAEADETELQRQHEVCMDIKNALKKVSSTYEVIPFGSAVNGLAFKNSDFDLFYGQEAYAKTPAVVNVFQKVKTALQGSKIIKDMRPVPNARVPIIKFIHKASGYSCDLSFKNTMGVQNSKLIKFLVSLDSRIKPFFLIIKYWAKLHYLTGRRMSNYSLILVMICFLQSLNDPILPPLYKLQHDNIRAVWINGWNAAFDDDPTRLRPVSNNLSLDELVTRFFSGFVSTDFANHVVSPYLGCLIPKDHFHKRRLPEEMSLYVNNVDSGKHMLKIDTPLCIEDPIELNFNLTKGVAEHDFKCFRDHCLVASKMAQEVPPDDFLPKLLSLSFECRQVGPKKTWLPNPMHAQPLRPFMTLHVPYPKNLSENISWTCELTKKITLIFKKVLKISIEAENKGKDFKPGDDQEFVCKGSQVLWIQRDKLWNRWYTKKRNESASSKSCSNEIEVLDITQASGSSTSEHRGEKRKREIEDNSESKRRKSEEQNSNDADKNVMLIDLEESAESIRNSSHHRNMEVEINLTKDMVRYGHALPATSFILYFSCKICRSCKGVRIEIADRRSKNNYFASLCAFLEEFLNTHMIEP